MHKNMTVLMLKHKFQQKLLNLWHIFLIEIQFTNCVDFEVGLGNVAKF